MTVSRIRKMDAEEDAAAVQQVVCADIEDLGYMACSSLKICAYCTPSVNICQPVVVTKNWLSLFPFLCRLHNQPKFRCCRQLSRMLEMIGVQTVLP